MIQVLKHTANFPQIGLIFRRSRSFICRSHLIFRMTLWNVQYQNWKTHYLNSSLQNLLRLFESVKLHSTNVKVNTKALFAFYQFVLQNFSSWITFFSSLYLFGKLHSHLRLLYFSVFFMKIDLTYMFTPQKCLFNISMIFYCKTILLSISKLK